MCTRSRAGSDGNRIVALGIASLGVVSSQFADTNRPCSRCPTRAGCFAPG
jgi:hypothetical protein